MSFSSLKYEIVSISEYRINWNKHSNEIVVCIKLVYYYCVHCTCCTRTRRPLTHLAFVLYSASNHIICETFLFASYSFHLQECAPFVLQIYIHRYGSLVLDLLLYLPFAVTDKKPHVDGLVWRAAKKFIWMFYQKVILTVLLEWLKSKSSTTKGGQELCVTWQVIVIRLWEIKSTSFLQSKLKK